MDNFILNLAGIEPESIVDGPGIRFAIFCQGCPHNCEGCHNPDTHSFEGGTRVRARRLLEEIDKDPIIKGVTFSGGEPICQSKAFLKLAGKIKERPLDIVMFTGFIYEDLLEYARTGHVSGKETITNMLVTQASSDIADLLELTDILIDGPFVMAERDLELQFRGSRNQRVIDLNATREVGQIVLYS